MATHEDISRWIDERREVAVYLDERELIHVIRFGIRNRNGYEYLQVPILNDADIPEDAVVSGVHHDWAVRGFYVRFAHGSFEPTYPGSETKVLAGVDVTKSGATVSWRDQPKML